MVKRFLSFQEPIKGPLLKYYRNNSNTYFTGNPIEDDNQLKMAAPNMTRFGKTVTQLKWSLGGFNGEDSQIANADEYQLWINSFFNEYGPADFRENRPAGTYVYRDRQAPGNPVESFSKDMMAASFNTLSTLVNSDRTRNQLSTILVREDREVADAFIRILSQIPTPAVQRFDYNTIAGVGFAIRSLADLLDRMPQFTENPNYLDEPGNIYIVAQAIRSALSREQIIDSLLLTSRELQSNPTYNYYFVSEMMPFVTSYDTNSLIERSNQPTGQALVNPDYSRYFPVYEEAVAQPEVPIGVQPDNYVYRLYSSASATPNQQIMGQDGVPVSNSWPIEYSTNGQELYSRYRSILTLNSNMPESSIDNTRLIDYLAKFSEVAPSIPEDDRITVTNSTTEMIIPSEEMTMLEDTRQSYPFSIGVEFEADDVGPIGQLIEEGGVSIPIMQALKDSPTYNRQHTVVSTVVNQRLADPSQKYLSLISQNFPLSLTSVTYLLDFGRQGQTIDSLVLSADGTPYTTGRNITAAGIDKLSVRLRRQWINVANSEYSPYTSVLTPDERTSSEALCYRLVKRSEGRVVKDIFIGNGSTSNNDRQLSFIDTQIKYNENYEYELLEYRCVYSTNYQVFSIPSVPNWMKTGQQPPPNTDPSMVMFDIIVAATPSIKIIEVPLYSRQKYQRFVTSPAGLGRNNGLYYPIVKVRDFPPPPPELLVIPYMDNYRQVQIGIKRSTGDYTGNSSLPIVSIGYMNERIAGLHQYQRNFENYNLKPRFLGYRNESTNEVRRATLYRTESMNVMVSSYNQLYSSFNPQSNSDVYVRKYSIGPTEDPDVIQVNSFDLMETLEPNKEYFYTAIVEDIHGNPSNPSPIYRVRLLYDKGLYIPEVELFQFTPVNTKVPTRKFARFLHIEPSDIQTFPFNEENEEGVLVGTRNLATNLGDTIDGRNFLVRLTSRDTGRKVDIKLSFTQRDINE